MRRLSGRETLGNLFRAGLFVLGLPGFAHACAVCVGSSPEDAGYFWGVLFLMAMPFTVGGLIGGWLCYHFRRAHGDALPSAASAIAGGLQAHRSPIAPAPASQHNGSSSAQT